MLKNIADEIAFILVRNRIIDSEKRELYAYGAEVVLLNLINLIIPLVISLLSGTLRHYIVFILVFIPLRISSGGYHAKKSENCIIISTLLYVMSIFLFNLSLIEYVNVILFILFIFSILAIAIFAPVENINNTLNFKSRKRNRLVSLLLVSVDSIAILLLEAYISSSVIIFVILASTLMVIGKFHKNA